MGIFGGRVSNNEQPESGIYFRAASGRLTSPHLILPGSGRMPSTYLVLHIIPNYIFLTCLLHRAVIIRAAFWNSLMKSFVIPASILFLLLVRSSGPAPRNHRSLLERIPANVFLAAKQKAN